MVLFEASKTILWSGQFLTELGFPHSTRTIIYEDNKSAIDIIHKSNDKGRTKHIDIRYHYIRELLKDQSHIVQVHWWQGILVKYNLVCGGIDEIYISTLQTKLQFIKFIFLLHTDDINIISNYLFVFAYILIPC